MNKKFLVYNIAMHFLGTPYKWGGDDPLAGFDCSGFVIELLKSVGKLPLHGDWRAKDLYKHFKENETDIAELGCLVFWGNSEETIYHVEVCIDGLHTIGASGGGSGTKTNQDAINQNAYIKIRPLKFRKNIFKIVNPFLIK